MSKSPVKRVLTSNITILLVVMALIGVVAVKAEFGGEADPPAIADDHGMPLTATEAMALVKGGTDMDTLVADAVAAAKERAYKKQKAIEKKAREKAAWYKKNKAKIEAKKAAEKLAKMPNPSSEQNKQVGKQLNEARGWSKCWPELLQLWMKESGWNERADNPWSDAYGVPQALPGSKMASAGPNWQTNATTQILWGLGYIKARYKDPCGAWAFWQRNHWY